MLPLYFVALYVALAASSPSDELIPTSSVVATVKLAVPSSLPRGRQIVDANFQSYSIEFNYMQDYAGNTSHPNEFSYQMIQNLAQISGAYPIIRAGGSTQNRAVYVANQTEALNQTFSNPGDDQPSALTIGPKWFESFQQFPKGTQYIYGLNFFDGEDGLDQTVLQAAAAFKAVGEDIYAFEIGNEVDGWPGGSRRPANWTIQAYVDQWREYAAAVESQGIGSADTAEPRFQGCSFEAPRHLANRTDWNVANAVKDGMAKDGNLKTVADHDYMGAACEGSAVPSLKDNLLNRHRMTSLMYYHEVLGNETAALGVPYVLGETNSISCQGKAGISDVFGAAIWSIDYVFYVAALKVSRLYFHNGTPYRYSAWQPTTINGTTPYAKPLYYGNLFTATALAGGNKQVVNLVNETTLSAYAIYEAANGGNEPQLSSIAVVNLEMFNSTQDPSERGQVAFELPSETADWGKAEVRRLTAPGVEVKSNITLAGQYVDDRGKVVGTRSAESADGGRVLVSAGEAVLVSVGK